MLIGTLVFQFLSQYPAGVDLTRPNVAKQQSKACASAYSTINSGTLVTSSYLFILSFGCIAASCVVINCLHP